MEKPKESWKPSKSAVIWKWESSVGWKNKKWHRWDL